ncbi:MAG TPA: hypothetical protein VFW40_00510, partial [Capsulimonadaceae bacterium]|nr:hypothetical protein [Capsulimonadaceae bacterium]
ATHAGPLKAWKLAFVRNGDIWIANGDGTGQRVLIKNGDVPCWSPDKKQIAFERDSNIWVANVDGSHQRPLTNQWRRLKRDSDGFDVENIGITWDKKLAIFYSHGGKRSLGPWSPATTSLMTIPLRPLSECLYMNGDDSTFSFSDRAFPAVSRSGNFCAFVCNGDLWVAARDKGGEVPGWNISRLDAVAKYDHGTNRGDAWEVGATHISWAPNERSLAYSFDRLTGGGQWQIYILQIRQGRGDTPTSRSDRMICDDGTYPSFSPDGKWIAYWGPWTCGANPMSIWVMTSAGENARLLIKNGSSPAW